MQIIFRDIDPDLAPGQVPFPYEEKAKKWESEDYFAEDPLEIEQRAIDLSLFPSREAYERETRIHWEEWRPARDALKEAIRKEKARLAEMKGANQKK